MVEAFKNLPMKWDLEENAMLKKSVVTKKVWPIVIEKSNKCKQQLAAFGHQVGVV